MASTVNSTSAGTSSSSMIDVQGIVEQLMTAERRPLAALQTAKSGIQTKVSAFGKIKSDLSALQDAVRTLYDNRTWQAAKVASGNEAAVKATSTGGAPKGAFSVTVQQLAQSQSAATAPFASPTAVVGGGTLVVQLGNSAGGGFAADPARPAVNIAVAAGATLADVRTAINNAGAGVSASLVNDGGQTRLLIRASDSGQANAFSIAVQGAENAGAGGLGGLAFTPGGGGGMTQLQAAQDAQYSLDGLALTSSSNTIADALEGVNLDLRQVSAAPVPIQVGVDAEALRKSVDTFVTAYNTVNATLTEMTKYDAAAGKGGTLQGEFSVVQLQSRLRAMLGTPITAQGAPAPGATALPARLSDVGIEIQRDGSLKVNEKKFEGAAASPQNLRSLFGSVDPLDTAGGGIARRFNGLISQTLGVDGSITGALKTLDARAGDNDKRQDAIESRLEATRARLLRVYSKLDAQLSAMNNLSTSLAGQLAKLNND